MTVCVYAIVVIYPIITCITVSPAGGVHGEEIKSEVPTIIEERNSEHREHKCGHD